jgi:2-aminobenzoate-CoA ligase
MAHQDEFVHQRLPRCEAWPTMRYDLPEVQFGPDLNTTTALFDKARQNNWMQQPFLRNQSQTVSYETVEQRVNIVLEQIKTQWQLPTGSRVLLRGGNSIGLAIAWLAVCKAGYIVVASMPLLRAKELTEIVNKAQITHALCDELLRDELATVLSQNTTPLTTVNHFDLNGQFNITSVSNQSSQPTKTGTGTESNNNTRSLIKIAQVESSLIEHNSGKHNSGEHTPGQYTPNTDDIGLLAFTSGTTGTPKAACHSHRDMLAACNAWPRDVLKANQNDIVLGSPPLAFTFGLGGLLLFPMSVGASVYFHDRGYTPETMVDAINQVKATIVYTAPTFYRQMAPLAKQKGLSSVRISVSAGEALPDATRQLWKDSTNLNMLDGIGATELFHIFISSAGDAIREGAIGKVVEGYQARVVDDTGHEVPRGSIGKLAVIGPTGCKYLDDPRQANYVKDGWNYPGDAFYQDADGYFFYQSRTDDLIVSAGYNISGPEVESCLLSHDAVAECAVIGLSDLERGMIVKACVVLKSNIAETESTKKLLQDWVKQQLAPYKYPRQIEFVHSLPRTETGKLQRFKLRKA